MQIARLTFNPFQENTYVVWDDTGESIIVDAGNYSAAEDKALSHFIEERGLRPVMAVCTHGHVDHILGVQYVRKTFGAAFALHSDDAFLVETAPQHGRIYGFDIKDRPSIDMDLKGVGELRFGNTVLKIIHTPGHTPGHICLYEPQSRVLLSGDTLFRESIGRTDLPGGNYDWIMKSIIDLILPLGPEVVFYPGHGSDSTLGHEMLYNPFITEVFEN